MKYISFLLLLILFGCSNSYSLLEESGEGKKVFLSAEHLELISDTDNFSKESKTDILNGTLIDSLGSALLKDVLNSYSSMAHGFEYTDNASDAAYVISIKKIIIDQAYFTLNIPHPGPIYKMEMQAEILQNDIPIETLSYNSRANMAAVNFTEEAAHWMSSEEKSNPVFQQATFTKALRDCYQKLYFNLFDIHL